MPLTDEIELFKVLNCVHWICRVLGARNLCDVGHFVGLSGHASEDVFQLINIVVRLQSFHAQVERTIGVIKRMKFIVDAISRRFVQTKKDLHMLCTCTEHDRRNVEIFDGEYFTLSRDPDGVVLQAHGELSTPYRLVLDNRVSIGKVEAAELIEIDVLIGVMRAGFGIVSNGRP